MVSVRRRPTQCQPRQPAQQEQEQPLWSGRHRLLQQCHRAASSAVVRVLVILMAAQALAPLNALRPPSPAKKQKVPLEVLIPFLSEELDGATGHFLGEPCVGKDCWNEGISFLQKNVAVQGSGVAKVSAAVEAKTTLFESRQLEAAMLSRLKKRCRGKVTKRRLRKLKRAAKTKVHHVLRRLQQAQLLAVTEAPKPLALSDLAEHPSSFMAEQDAVGVNSSTAVEESPQRPEENDGQDGESPKKERRRKKAKEKEEVPLEEGVGKEKRPEKKTKKKTGNSEDKGPGAVGGRKKKKTKGADEGEEVLQGAGEMAAEEAKEKKKHGGKKDSGPEGDGDNGVGGGSGGEGDGASGGDEDEKKEGDEDDEVWQLTEPEKIWLEVGWFLEFLFYVVAVVLYLRLASLLTAGDKDDSDPPSASNDGGALVGLLWGRGAAGTAVSTIVLLLSFLNFYSYAVVTEAREGEEEYQGLFDLPTDARSFNQYVEQNSFVIFTIISILRLAAVVNHPDWKHFGPTAPVRYMVGNVCMAAEIFALAITARSWSRWQWASKTEHMNWLWIFSARMVEMLQRNGLGVGFGRLGGVIYGRGKLLLTCLVLVFVIWIPASGTYHVLNENGDGEGGWPETSTWESVQFFNETSEEWEPWRKFESIPSSMWFVLVNLNEEHPLADAHVTFGQRLAVCLVCIFAIPIFALPVAVLQEALLSIDEGDDDDDDEGDNDDDELMKGNMEHIKDMWEVRFYQGVATCGMVFLSIYIYFAYTARKTTHSNYLGFGLKIGPKVNALVDGSVALIFFVEWIRHLRGGMAYLYSRFCLFDVLAFLPGMIHGLAFIFNEGKGTVDDYLCACCVLRVLKLERYLLPLSMVGRVAHKERGLLCATFALSFVLWMLFSVLFYISEIPNPDGDIRENYGSVMRTGWAEIIHLHGEYPWADFTATGKALGCISCFFSVMLFCIPLSVAAQGFQDLLEAAGDQQERDNYDKRPWQTESRPLEASLPQKCYDLLYAHLHVNKAKEALPSDAWAMRLISISMTLASMFVTIVGTVDDADLGQYSEGFHKAAYFIDCVTSVYFAIELSMRVLAVGVAHMSSVAGVCDFFSLVSILFSLTQMRERVFHPLYAKDDTVLDDMTILCRSLRLFSLDSYFHTWTVMKGVVWLNRTTMTRAWVAMVMMWYTHATLLYLFEHNPECTEEGADGGPAKGAFVQTQSWIATGAGTSGEGRSLMQLLVSLRDGGEGEGEGEDEDMEMCQRYVSIPRALQYSIVHLSGDFPETDYTFRSKIVHFLGILFGTAISSVFCGVFAASFQNFLSDMRMEELEKAAKFRLAKISRCAVLIQRFARKARSGKAVRGPQASSATVWCRRTVDGTTTESIAIMSFFYLVLVLNLVVSLVDSLPEIHQHYAGSNTVFIFFEIACTLIFFVEFGIRMMAEPARDKNRFFRIVDFICLIPGVLNIIFIQVRLHGDGTSNIEEAIEFLLCLRAVRLIDFPYFRNEVNLIYAAMRDALPMLAVPGFTALNIWVMSSCVFMWVENYYKEEGGEAEHMRNVPATMYWTCIYLIGEWANVDFTYAGSRMSIFYVLFGVAICSVPIGIIVESVQSMLEKEALEKLDAESLTALTLTKPAPDSGGESTGAVKNMTRKEIRRSLMKTTSAQPYLFMGQQLAPGRPVVWAAGPAPGGAVPPGGVMSTAALVGAPPGAVLVGAPGAMPVGAVHMGQPAVAVAAGGVSAAMVAASSQAHMMQQPAPMAPAAMVAASSQAHMMQQPAPMAPVAPMVPTQPAPQVDPDLNPSMAPNF